MIAKDKYKHTYVKLSENQKDFIELLPLNKPVDVATSNYSIDPIKSTGWNPITRTSAQMIDALTKKGIITSNKFWRGATVTRII